MSGNFDLVNTDNTLLSHEEFQDVGRHQRCIDKYKITPSAPTPPDFHDDTFSLENQFLTESTWNIRSYSNLENIVGVLRCKRQVENRVAMLFQWMQALYQKILDGCLQTSENGYFMNWFIVLNNKSDPTVCLLLGFQTCI